MDLVISMFKLSHIFNLEMLNNLKHFPICISLLNTLEFPMHHHIEMMSVSLCSSC